MRRVGHPRDPVWPAPLAGTESPRGAAGVMKLDVLGRPCVKRRTAAINTVCNRIDELTILRAVARDRWPSVDR
jgi:hypothetical protein